MTENIGAATNETIPLQLLKTFNIIDPPTIKASTPQSGQSILISPWIIDDKSPPERTLTHAIATNTGVFLLSKNRLPTGQPFWRAAKINAGNAPENANARRMMMIWPEFIDYS